MNFIDNIQGLDYGEYDAGEEPEDSDSQNGNDEDGDFDEEDEEGDEDTDEDDDKGKGKHRTAEGFLEKPKTEEQDTQSKESTACTNDDQVQMKIKKLIIPAEIK